MRISLINWPLTRRGPTAMGIGWRRVAVGSHGLTVSHRGVRDLWRVPVWRVKGTRRAGQPRRANLTCWLVVRVSIYFSHVPGFWIGSDRIARFSLVSLNKVKVGFVPGTYWCKIDVRCKTRICTTTNCCTLTFVVPDNSYISIQQQQAVVPVRNSENGLRTWAGLLTRDVGAFYVLPHKLNDSRIS